MRISTAASSADNLSDAGRLVMSLDMKEAVKMAREQAAQLFAEESRPNLALEKRSNSTKKSSIGY